MKDQEVTMRNDCQGAARVGLLHAEGMIQELSVTPAQAVSSPTECWPIAAEHGRQNLITGSINKPPAVK